MSDRLLRELGDLARSETKAEEARFDDRWDHLAAGTLTAQEEAELKAFAESEPEDREAYEAFRPLGPDFQARMVQAIQAEQAKTARPEPPPKPEPKPLPRVLPFRRVIRRAEAWVGLAAAVAAGLFFLVRTPEYPISSAYMASLDGGFKATRGSEPSSPGKKPAFTQGSPFRLTASPQDPLDHPGKLKPAAFLSSSAGREGLKPLKSLDGKFEIGDTGSVRLDVRMGEDLKVEPGDWILWTVVARKSLPKVEEIQERLRAHQPRNASWQTLCDALRQEEKPPPPPSSWQVACAGFRSEGSPAP